MIAEAAHGAAKSVAVKHGHLEITYGALMTAADALAAELRGLGAGPNVPVGVCVERSIEHVVALLGVLRSGGAFLPLDPGWPPERIRFVLDDAAAPIVVADPRHREAVTAPGRAVVEAGGAWRRRAGGAAAGASSGDDIAYVIYTSGSTGEPKGVEITHANLLNLVTWHREAFGVTRQDHGSWVAGLAFDASVWELFPCLAVGATIHVAGEPVRASAEALRRWLLDEGVSIAFAPTPLAESLLSGEWPAGAALRTLLTGGDTLHVRPGPGLPFKVVNNYGPTECTVVATSGPVAAGAAADELPSIGRPIAGARIHILDADGNPAPAGRIGEIHVAGAGVGRGYRNRPSLTAERFVSISPGGGPAERCYRTGDLGSWTADGEIAFHGRSDAQIKQRGHRIEPDEITAALSRHPLVAQSAVVAEGEGAAAQLVAYVVPAGEKTPRSPDLRAFLATSLPTYMLPSLYVRVASLPITANGKLDRSALPSATSANTLPSAPYREPQSLVERRIAAMVEELLEIDEVGLDDNFFLLGGHSLLGTQLVLRLRDAFGAELALRDLFEAQTIQNLASKVERSVVELVAAMSEEEVQQRLAPSYAG